MPATSQAQRGLVFGKRNQYGSKEKTPKKWIWIWGEEWENKGKLPAKKTNESFNVDSEDYTNEFISVLIHDYDWSEEDAAAEAYNIDWDEVYDNEIYPEELANRIASVDETVQNVVFNESYRAKLVNESFYTPYNNADEYYTEVSNAFEKYYYLSKDELVFEEFDEWMETNKDRVESFRLSKTNPQQVADLIYKELRDYSKNDNNDDEEDYEDYEDDYIS